MARKKKNYIDNQKFYEHIKEYIYEVRRCREKGVDKPRVPEYIGHCLLLIGQNLVNHRWFRNYDFTEDMVMEGVLNCLEYLDNFDPDKYNNPHAYFTMVIWRAFQRKKDKEKKYLYTKFKAIEKINVFGSDMNELNEVEEIIQADATVDYMNEFIKKFETSLEEKKRKKENVTATD